MSTDLCPVTIGIGNYSAYIPMPFFDPDNYKISVSKKKYLRHRMALTMYDFHNSTDIFG